MTHFWATFEVEFPPHLTYKLNIDDAMDHLDFLELRLVRLRDLTESPLLITLLPFFWKFLSVYSCSSSILPADKLTLHCDNVANCPLLPGKLSPRCLLDGTPSSVTAAASSPLCEARRLDPPPPPSPALKLSSDPGDTAAPAPS